MVCSECGLEMILYSVDAETGEREYVCRNPRCGSYDERLKKPEEQKTENQ